MAFPKCNANDRSIVKNGTAACEARLRVEANQVVNQRVSTRRVGKSEVDGKGHRLMVSREEKGVEKNRRGKERGNRLKDSSAQTTLQTVNESYLNKGARVLQIRFPDS